MKNRSWQHQQYNGFERQVIIDENRAIKKWTPLIENVQFDDYTFDVVIEKMSVFAELYQLVDSNKYVSVQQPWSPIAGVHVGGMGVNMNQSGMGGLGTTQTTVDPPGWIELPIALRMISIKIKEHMKFSSLVNLEIEKEYYNIITGEKTLLLKDSDNERVILDFELEEEKKEELLSIIDEEILFILEPIERKRRSRKSKLKSLLFDLRTKK